MRLINWSLRTFERSLQYRMLLTCNPRGQSAGCNCRCESTDLNWRAKVRKQYPRSLDTEAASQWFPRFRLTSHFVEEEHLLQIMEWSQHGRGPRSLFQPLGATQLIPLPCPLSTTLQIYSFRYIDISLLIDQNNYICCHHYVQSYSRSSQLCVKK